MDISRYKSDKVTTYTYPTTSYLKPTSIHREYSSSSTPYSNSHLQDLLKDIPIYGVRANSGVVADKKNSKKSFKNKLVDFIKVKDKRVEPVKSLRQQPVRKMSMDKKWDEIVTEQVQNGYTGNVETISYTQSQMVGHGSFGVVFKTKILPTNETAAIKRVFQDRRYKNRELKIMRLVHHRNIVDLKYYFYQNQEQDLYLNLILEFVPETLYKASHYYTSKRMNMPALEIKLYTYQMFRALNYIHSQGICHRDIKPQNLLVDPERNILKLCDFGSAKILSPSEKSESYICSRYYRAPELIFDNKNYTTKIDVWSAGCVMGEMILGQPLFPGESGLDQLVEIIKILGTPSKEQIRNMNPRYMEHKFPQIKPIPLNKIFKKCDTYCLAILNRILQYSPIERISCVEALADPYFDELRDPNFRLPNFRNSASGHSNVNNNNNLNTSNGNYEEFRPVPEFFDFDRRELSIRPDLNHKLIPEFALDRLIEVDLNNFVPMTQEELKIDLD